MACLESIKEQIAREMNLQYYNCPVPQCKAANSFPTLTLMLVHCLDKHPNAKQIGKWKKCLLKAPETYLVEAFYKEIQEFNLRVEQRFEVVIREKIGKQQNEQKVSISVQTDQFLEQIVLPPLVAVKKERPMTLKRKAPSTYLNRKGKRIRLGNGQDRPAVQNLLRTTMNFLNRRVNEEAQPVPVSSVFQENVQSSNLVNKVRQLKQEVQGETGQANLNTPQSVPATVVLQTKQHNLWNEIKREELTCVRAKTLNLSVSTNAAPPIPKLSSSLRPIKHEGHVAGVEEQTPTDVPMIQNDVAQVSVLNIKGQDRPAVQNLLRTTMNFLNRRVKEESQPVPVSSVFQEDVQASNLVNKVRPLKQEVQGETGQANLNTPQSVPATVVVPTKQQASNLVLKKEVQGETGQANLNTPQSVPAPIVVPTKQHHLWNEIKREELTCVRAKTLNLNVSTNAAPPTPTLTSSLRTIKQEHHEVVVEDPTPTDVPMVQNDVAQVSVLNIKKEIAQQEVVNPRTSANGIDNGSPAMLFSVNAESPVCSNAALVPLEYAKSKPIKIEPGLLSPMKQLMKLLRKD